MFEVARLHFLKVVFEAVVVHDDSTTTFSATQRCNVGTMF